MRVADGGVQVDALVAAVKEAVRRAGVSSASDARDLRVESVQLTLEVVASRSAGGGLNLRVPVIGTEARAGGKVTKMDTHTIDIVLVPPAEPPARAVRSGDVEDALVQAISTIRATIDSAAGGDDPWMLSAGTVDISFGVTKEGSISLGFDGAVTSEVTHTLRLILVSSSV